jgi:hypothetical protein
VKFWLHTEGVSFPQNLERINNYKHHHLPKHLNQDSYRDKYTDYKKNSTTFKQDLTK